jgi:hypothetical protein
MIKSTNPPDHFAQHFTNPTINSFCIINCL